MKIKRPSKTRFVALLASSVDGRISLAKKTSPDWTSKEDWKFFQDFLLKVDAVVVGRNTYEAAKISLRKRITFVLSSRIKNSLPKEYQTGSVTFVNPKNVNLKRLFRKFKTVAVLGGSFVYQTMLEKGLMDDLYVTFEPLIFGRGTEMFRGGRKTKRKTTRLSLQSMRNLNNSGTILLHYKV